MRVVLDTNIIVSGLLWRGTPQTVLRSGLVGSFTLIANEDLFSELALTLERSKFQKYLDRANRNLYVTLSLIRSSVEIVSSADIPMDAVRDPKDRIVLACAVGGHSDYIVSGDKDLLVLESYEGIPIVTPRDFLEQILKDMP